ncbi:hypothetical protein ACHAWO_009135 [Cyclotella atomus]|uniref:tRNA N(3)-methylcytidine methyltransferase n=1 Tax=Cyclotella atomus TaxID=382360 RepID=A0ABD3PPC0_9STRA
MVQYYDSDFSFEEHRIECEQKLQSTTSSSTCTSNHEDDEDLASLNPMTQAQCWDDFHTAHSHGNFFKPRRYILKCFPCILNHCAADNNLAQNIENCNQRYRLVLEVGCGSGSSCLPILKHCNDEHKQTKILACDCSAVAVDVCKSVIESSKDTIVVKNFGAFVSDPSLEVGEAETTFPEDVKAAYEKLTGEKTEGVNDIGLADVVLMVFVLSAVPPKRVTRFMKQIFNTAKSGGKVCFRDYALYDLPMMRFKETHYVHSTCSDSDGAAPRLYERGDGTLSRFFDLETVKCIFEAAGFVEEDLRYATVFNENRKTGDRLKRAFVHSVFRKP